MYDLKQFKPVLYLLILIGFSGFAISAELPGIWLLSVGAVVLNGWLVYTDRFTPIPRWLANLVTLLSLLYVADRVLSNPASPILTIGQFLVLLQIVKLFEQRANRDYAQLLVLSLLLMVAAAISTASLLFGIIFIAHLFLCLYCCLLFHLKVESEQARLAITDPQRQLNPATLRQDQRYLGRSMRRLTGLVAGAAICMAVIVFLTFPRGTGGNLIGPLRFRPSQTLTGFSDQVSFEQVARITQSNDHVATVSVEHNGTAVDGSRILFLRGLALDVYNGASPGSPGGGWRWTRSRRPGDEHMPGVVLPGQAISFDAAAPDGDVWKQRITLNPTGTRVLFSIAGPVSFMADREVNLLYSAQDQVIESRDMVTQPLTYTVLSTDSLRGVEAQPADNAGAGDADSQDEADKTPAHSVIDPKILAYASLPEVSGVDSATGKSLAMMRPRTGGPNALDETIARNISRHLQNTFTYTLDLTDAAKILRGQDPLVAFLYDLKRGHCEYFAGAMTLMCQSLGMQARLVVGFKCDDYNALGHFYEVDQSHAHAWVEVLTPDGFWKTFDPTSSQDTRINVPSTAFSRIKHFFGYLEFKWAQHVVAYDNEARANLLEKVETRMTNTATGATESVSGFRRWISDAANFLSISTEVLELLVVLVLMAGVLAVGYFIVERWRLRRRAERIGLENVPDAERLKLARQLKFYADLTSLLYRRHIVRPRHLTPQEFADTLTFLPSESYEQVQYVTRLFYQVRFGRQALSQEEQRQLPVILSELDSRLPTVSGI